MAREAPTTQLITGDELAVDIGQHHVRDLVRTENRRQLQKWGVQDHEPFYWLAILMEEVGEVAEAMIAESGAQQSDHVVSVWMRSVAEQGRIAKYLLEGAKADRKQLQHEGHDVGEETIHVAAVAVAMEESRRRMIVERGESVAVSAW